MYARSLLAWEEMWLLLLSEQVVCEIDFVDMIRFMSAGEESFLIPRGLAVYFIDHVRDM